ncbi:c-type cytochrome biogenesis protein CcmI [Rhodovulum visakhapatnamense]|uniref:Cytochrome c-type biogenesis protein CcmH n=1 Tax=Rhodovulum visakhapatnamense TaxID=364297 RepID=A0A4R8FD80_9RHOB|nr:c-type cytochrome biogenesis protein CcmI [Rhodovulum visakhapatnamense]TDX23746.1 cytochrome c-type biogenesis protein CcmH [Rhodovulum visakhapatnamense]
MTFIVVAIGMAAVIAAVLTLTLIRGRRGDEPAAAYDLRVYREQLDEVERDLARGVIAEDEAARIRTEVSRRVLEADRKLARQAATGQAPKALSLVAGIAVLAFLLGGAWITYSYNGMPGYADQPLDLRKAEAADYRETRMRQAEAEAKAPPMPGLPTPDAEHLKLVEKLRQVVAERGDDLQGLDLLAHNEAALGNFKAAYEAQAKVIALKGAQATANDYATQADMMVLASSGYVSPEAEAALEQALNRNPQNGTALYYWGLMHIQTGRPDIAFRVWRELLNVSKADDPWLPIVREQMPNLAWYAGDERYQLPPMPAAGGAPGPSAEDMAAAEDMTPEARQEMIRGMVARLSARLADQGGSPEEWARLIGALGVLGDREQAGAIWAEAQQTFAAQPDALATIRQAAQSAGVAE